MHLQPTCQFLYPVVDKDAIESNVSHKKAVSNLFGILYKGLS